MMPPCTYLGCEAEAVQYMAPSSGGGGWFGCAKHAPAMVKALANGLSGASSGSGWVEVTILTPSETTP